MATKKIRCVVIGDGAVGKTCLLIRYAKNHFPPGYVPEGSRLWDYYEVAVKIQGAEYQLSLFDTPGQEDFDRLRQVCYFQADIFLVCFSVVLPDSFEHVKLKWIKEIEYHRPKTPFILVGLQTDLRQDQATLNELAKYKQEPITAHQGKKLAEKIKAVKYVECSALTQEGVKEVFDEAIMAVLSSSSTKCKSGCCIS